MNSIEVHIGCCESGTGVDYFQLGSYPVFVADHILVCGVECARADQGHWKIIYAGGRSCVTCFTGDEGISDSISGDRAGVDPHVDQIIGGVGAVADRLDVDHLATPQTGVYGGDQGSRFRRDVDDLQWHLRRLSDEDEC